MRYLWYAMYAFVTALAVYSLFFSPRRGAVQKPAPTPRPVVEDQPAPPATSSATVQIALLLDTSSSMDGLIEQARVQLWEIVGALQTDDSDQPRQVEVALFQYGNSRISERDGFIEKLSDLTSDLDPVSVRLHALSTSGGKEYAPRAIWEAVEQLAWSSDDNVERVIVIAGNEGFGQGDVSTEEAMKRASERGIRVIAIFCANGGATSTGLSSWERAAQLASSPLETIDPDKVVEKLETPFDADLVAKYKALESTRLTYGEERYQKEVESANYQAASVSAGTSVAVQADRAVTQSRQAVRADLTSDYGHRVQIDQLPSGSLPTALRGLPKVEQVEVIAARREERARLEGEIAALSAKRRSHQKGMVAPSAAPSLGSSVREALAR